MQEEPLTPELVAAAVRHYYSTRRLIVGTLRVAVLVAIVPALIVWGVIDTTAALVAFAMIVAVYCGYALASELVARRKGFDLAPTLDPSDRRARILVDRYLADTRRKSPP